MNYEKIDKTLLDPENPTIFDVMKDWSIKNNTTLTYVAELIHPKLNLHNLFFFNDKEEIVIGFSPVEFPRTELLGLCQLGSQSYYVGQEPFFLFEVEQILNGENCPKFNKHKKAEGKSRIA